MGFRLIDRCTKLLDVNMLRGVTGRDYFMVEVRVKVMGKSQSGGVLTEECDWEYVVYGKKKHTRIHG